MKESKTGLSLNDRRTVVLEQVVPLKLVQLNFTQPFTWASGWLSPIYCNFRQLLRYPQARGVTARALAQGVRENYPNATVILGVATGSIAIAMAVAEELGLPYGYVREKPKDHGTGDQIEGGIEKGDQAVIVEDVVSTGGSLLRAVEAVRNDGRAEVLGTATIMTYGFPVAIESFEKADCSLVSVLDYDLLLQYGVNKGIIAESAVPALKEFKDDPAKWGERYK